MPVEETTQTPTEVDSAQAANPEVDAPSTEDAELASAEQQMREWLSSKTGVGQTDSADTDQPTEGGDDGEQGEATEAAETGTDADAPSADTPSGDDTDEPTTPSGDDSKRAINALKRAQYPEDVIEGLGERAVEIGLRLADQYAETDRLGRERSNLRKMLDEIEAERSSGDDAAPDADDKGSEDAAAPADDAPDPVADFIAALRDDPLMDRHADKLESVLLSIRSRGDGKPDPAVNDRLEALQSENQSLYRALDDVRFENARSGLVDRFPKLSDNQTFSAVKQRAYQLSKLDGYRDPESGEVDWNRLVTDAATLEKLDTATTQEVQDKLLSRHRKQASGQVTDDTDHEPQPKSLTENQASKKVFDLIASGKSPEEARAIVSAMPIK